MAGKEGQTLHELRGWKQIAGYLAVTVRTAQLWEKQRGLPVYRHPGPRGSVYAYGPELARWRQGHLTPVKTARARARLYRWGAAVVAAAIVLTVALVVYRNLFGGPEVAHLNAVPLTSDPGREYGANLSPRRMRVVFLMAAGSDGPVDVVEQNLAGGVRRLVAANVFGECRPRYSPNGESIAFARMEDGELHLVISAAGSGEERVVTRLAEPEHLSNLMDAASIAWSPDGASIAVTARTGDGGPLHIELVEIASGRRTVLSEPGVGLAGDTQPVFSPDGARLAFSRFTTASECNIYVKNLTSGALHRLTEDGHRVWGLAWLPDGQRLICSLQPDQGKAGLYLVSAEAGGESQAPVRISTMDGSAEYPSAAPDAETSEPRIVFEHLDRDDNIWAVRPAEPARPWRVTKSNWSESFPAVAPALDRIAYISRETGATEVWVADLHGGGATALTVQGGPYTDMPRWSPDGRHIAFTAVDSAGKRDVYVVDVATKQTRSFTDAPSYEGRASWSRDGQWIYFRSDRSGARQIWKQPFQGPGEAVAVTHGGGYEAFEGPLGKTVYFLRDRSSDELWKVPVAGGAEEKLLDGVRESRWWVTRPGIYYVRDQRVFLFQEGSAPREVLRLPAPVTDGFAASPDGSLLVWGQTDRSVADVWTGTITTE